MPSSDSAQASRQHRTLGLPSALAIGIGTMIGAGIFVFPGIAGGRAGPAAVFSFVLGGAVAMLVAGCTAELATAMPATGGAYHYASRTFGPLAGLLVGVAQCVGLVFASAFYLVAFGRYTKHLITGTGPSLDLPPVVIAFGAGLVLLVVNLSGTASSGKLQTGVVVALTAALALLFGYGLLRVIGLIGEAEQASQSVVPNGVLPVFTTAALVFTSYLGFVQIATVAGEIRRPGRTLPLALIGSVTLVTLLYALALFVTTRLLPSERLATLAESATVEVARLLAGNVGWLVVVSAGLLATLSSANASILSSSRALQALARDRLVPRPFARIHARFKVPHLALTAVGLSICALLFLDRLEILAAVASVLHLLIYALICWTLWYVRRHRNGDHEPTFRLPAGRVIAGTGLVACLGLLAWMQGLALLIGAAVIAAAVLWYAVYARGRYRERADDS